MKHEGRLLFILATVQFCHIIDFMIIMPLGETIMQEFDISPGRFARLVSAYAGAAVLGNVVSTAFIDRFDRRSALLFLFSGFTLATLACAFADTYAQLLVFRGMTGVFGGTLGGLVITVVGDVIPLERRASAMGWVMTAFSAASVVGVPAGILIAANYGWNSPFLVVAGLAGCFIVLAWWLVPNLSGHLTEETFGGAVAGATVEFSPAPPPLGVGGPGGGKSNGGSGAVQARRRGERAVADVIDAGAMPPLQKAMAPKSVFRQTLDPFVQIFTDVNQRAALVFTICLMLGHFTIIPFIAPYVEINIGFTSEQVSLVYLIGGGLTVVLLPLFGKLADRYGRMRVFTIASIFALGSIYALTNLETDSMVITLLVTSSFFVVASGRSVPATTMITSVVRPENRGSFMSIRQSANELALFLSTTVASFIITKDEAGRLINYEYLGYFTMLMSLVAVYAASRLRAVA